MNDQEALKKFTDKVLPLCLAETFDLRLFKEERKRFYGEASKKGRRLGHPGFRDVADAVIDLLRTRGNPTANILEFVTTRPFFKQIGDSEHEKLVSSIAASTDQFS